MLLSPPHLLTIMLIFDCDIDKCIDVVGIWADDTMQDEYDEDTDSDNDYV